jgi:hypothetical protein
MGAAASAATASSPSRPRAFSGTAFIIVPKDNANVVVFPNNASNNNNSKKADVRKTTEETVTQVLPFEDDDENRHARHRNIMQQSSLATMESMDLEGVDNIDMDEKERAYWREMNVSTRKGSWKEFEISSTVGKWSLFINYFLVVYYLYSSIRKTTQWTDACGVIQ